MNEKLYNELAGYYDLFNFNDYQKQAKFILDVIEKEFNKKKKGELRIVDLACGTGEHIKLLKKYRIEGLDINNGMLRIAKRKNPGVKLIKGDLNDLKLKETNYDVVVCLSSSIQYILSTENLANSFKAICKSLKNGGVFIFDVAYCKEKWKEGYVGIRTFIDCDLQIAEIFKSRSVNNISRYNPIYLINHERKTKFYIDDHKIYIYSLKEIKNILNNYFSSISIYNDYTFSKHSKFNNQIPVFVAKK